MAYDLSQFSIDLHDILREKGTAGLPEVAQKLSALLVNPEFIAQTFSDDDPPGKRVLFHDAASDAYVLAHVQPPNKTGFPHSHGTSWAIYGNVRGFTEMTEWRRINPQTEERQVLEPTANYRLGPGDTRAYQSGMIHSTGQIEKAWVVRVTGTDLDRLPRYHFRPRIDEMVQPAQARA
jgi:hypothetical protein